MRVTVTQEDIDNGIPNYACRCALALALERKTGEKWYVSSIAFPIRKDTKFALGANALEFIQTYDSDKSLVRPATFILKEITK